MKTAAAENATLKRKGSAFLSPAHGLPSQQIQPSQAEEGQRVDSVGNYYLGWGCQFG